MKEHIDAGFITSFIVSSLLFVGHAKGLVPTLHDLFVLMLFDWIGIVIGSDLPDIDSRTAPVHSFLGIGGIEFESAEGESLAERYLDWRRRRTARRWRRRSRTLPQNLQGTRSATVPD